MGLIAYELRGEFAGTVEQETDDGVVEVPVYSGGLVHVGTEGRELDVRDLLETGAGVIVVDDFEPNLVVALDEYPALKRATVPAGAVAVNAEAKYEELKVTELRAEASSRGIEGTGGATKGELILALEEHDRRLADDSLDDLGAPLTVGGLAAAAQPDSATQTPAAGDAGSTTPEA